MTERPDLNRRIRELVEVLEAAKAAIDALHAEMFAAADGERRGTPAPSGPPGA